ncbi:energy transducer TonB [Microbulbifer sp. ANSA005]|uniref:energy transducer TonB n=1 Tax=Microbulbifer sp. ANSA005 TaxID=3243362 RepID=UPI004041B418
MRRIVLPFFLLFSGWVFSGESKSEEVGDIFIGAKLIESSPLKYPPSEARSQREGWVVLSYVVSVEGVAVDAIVVDSSGNKQFERSALSNIKTWTWEPATLNGSPVEQIYTRSKFTFNMKMTSSGARRSFVLRYKEAASLIKNGSLDEAEVKIKKLGKREKWNHYEDSWFWWLKAQYNLAQGNKEAAYGNLLKSIAYDGVYLPGNFYMTALEILFLSQVERAYYSDALDTFSKMKEFSDGKYEDKILELSSIEEKIKIFLASDSPIAVSGAIGEHENWPYKLNRRKFYYQNIVGSVDKFELRCDRNRQVFEFLLDNTWEVPESWGACTVYVYGEEGTKVEIVELRG